MGAGRGSTIALLSFEEVLAHSQSTAISALHSWWSLLQNNISHLLITGWWCDGGVACWGCFSRIFDASYFNLYGFCCHDNHNEYHSSLGGPLVIGLLIAPSVLIKGWNWILLVCILYLYIYRSYLKTSCLKKNFPKDFHLNVTLFCKNRLDKRKMSLCFVSRTIQSVFSTTLHQRSFWYFRWNCFPLHLNEFQKNLFARHGK